MAIAIVLAAGVGSRMNSTIPKQFMKIKNKEIICYSLDVFQTDSNVTDIVLVTGHDYVAYCKDNIIPQNGYTKVRAVISGGRERYNSVYNGIIEAEKFFPDKCSENIIMIHDGARPFITHSMISDSLECIKSGFAGCTVAMPVKDTIKIVKKNGDHIIGEQTPDRSILYQVQTPQTFVCEKLHLAYDRLFEDKDHNITDDTMLMERYMGEPCAIVTGAYENIKITTPEDLAIGELLAEKREENSLKKSCTKIKKTC
jgi:2-C-methyl-D-erythritol 4-phosphate cytidylyltransferase